MHFSLEQSSDREAILRNLLEMHRCFPAGRPADAAEYLTLDREAILWNLLEMHRCFPAGRPADAAEYLTSDREAILRKIQPLLHM